MEHSSLPNTNPNLVKETLLRDCLDLLNLQRLSGKRISMSLAVPGAKLYVNEINLAVSRATCSLRPVKMSAALKKEIETAFFPGGPKSPHMFSDSSHFVWGGSPSPNATRRISSMINDINE